MIFLRLWTKGCGVVPCYSKEQRVEDIWRPQWRHCSVCSMDVGTVSVCMWLPNSGNSCWRPCNTKIGLCERQGSCASALFVRSHHLRSWKSKYPCTLIQNLFLSLWSSAKLVPWNEILRHHFSCFIFPRLVCLWLIWSVFPLYSSCLFDLSSGHQSPLS